jgi:hypothetical protein
MRVEAARRQVEAGALAVMTKKAERVKMEGTGVAVGLERSVAADTGAVAAGTSPY